MADINSTNPQQRSTTEQSSDRVATQRARYLERTTDLSDQERLALGYREQGYSHAAIARVMDSTKQTVASYMDRIVARYGLEAIGTKPVSERGDLIPVTERRIDQLADGVLDQWLKTAVDNPDRVPDAVDLDRLTPRRGEQQAGCEDG